MKKLIMFNMISVDGYFEGPGHDITWHTVDKEFNDFAVEQLNAMGTLIFGRITYELMAGYWPTSEALKDDPEVAFLMNAKEKIVCSTTMTEARWSRTQLIQKDVVRELHRLKSTASQDLIIFGSAKLCESLTRERLIDEYRIMVSPIVLKEGTPLFRERLDLKLRQSRRFGNGNMLLTYTTSA